MVKIGQKVVNVVIECPLTDHGEILSPFLWPWGLCQEGLASLGQPEQGWANRPDGPNKGKALVWVYAANATLGSTAAKGVRTSSLIFHYPWTLDTESEHKGGGHTHYG